MFLGGDSTKVPFSTERFVWIHTPKTGGQWLYKVITANAPPSWKASYGQWCHVRLCEVSLLLDRPERATLPVIACVRNPWDWYVSLYFWMEQHYVNRTGAFALPQNQREGLSRVWASDISRGNSIEGFQKGLEPLLQYAPDSVQSRFLCDETGALGVIPVRFERLREGFLEALHQVGAEVTPQLRDGVLQTQKYNTSGRPPFQRCYTDELVERVRKKERWIVDTFGYEPQ